MTGHTVSRALKTGITLIPEERRLDGIFGQLSIRANIPMMRMEKVLRNRVINRAKENHLADGYIKSMSVATNSRGEEGGPALPAGTSRRWSSRSASTGKAMSF